MCCFRTKVAKCFTATFSVLTSLAGLALIVVCFQLLLETNSVFSSSPGSSTQNDAIQTGPSPATETSDGLDEITKRVAIISFIGGAAAVVYGLLGICTAKVQKCGCTFIFGCLTIILTIVFILSSVVVLTLYFVTPSQVEQFCDEKVSTNELDGFSKTVVDDVNLYIDDIDVGLQVSVDEYMCTEICPCVEVDISLWSETAERNQLKNDAKFDFTGEYETFIECYTEQKVGWYSDPNRNQVNENVLGIVKTLEETYNCSGLCRKPMFWTHKSVKDGGPRQACIYQLKDDFDQNAVWIGWTLVTISILLFFVLFCHCGLYLTDDEKLKRVVRKRTFIMD